MRSGGFLLLCSLVALGCNEPEEVLGGDGPELGTTLRTEDAATGFPKSDFAVGEPIQFFVEVENLTFFVKSYVFSTSCQAHIEVFDAFGATVATFPDPGDCSPTLTMFEIGGEQKAGVIVTWNQLLDSGEPADPGAYSAIATMLIDEPGTVSPPFPFSIVVPSPE